MLIHDENDVAKRNILTSDAWEAALTDGICDMRANVKPLLQPRIKCS